jgi:hypothetical protein
LEPAQPPVPSVAVHEEALLVVQVRVEEPFSATLVGLALSVTVGAGVGASTVTLTERFVLPPLELVQASEKVVEVVRPAIVAVPLTARLPVQLAFAGLALAEQAFALVVVHVSVVEPCDATAVGLAERVTVGLVTGVPPPADSL